MCLFVSGFEHTLGHIQPKASAETQSQAALDVIKRTIPERVNEFSVEIYPNMSLNGKDAFEVISYIS